MAAAGAIGIYLGFFGHDTSCESSKSDACVRAGLWYDAIPFGAVALLAGGIVLFGAHRRAALSRALLAVGIVAFCIWGLFVDAAVHGWDDLSGGALAFELAGFALALGLVIWPAFLAAEREGDDHVT